MSFLSILIKAIKLLFTDFAAFKKNLKMLGSRGIQSFDMLKIKKISYSQYGEDLVLNAWIGGKKEGTYIEVGCFDPKYLSNTYLFYKKGWSGILIEPQTINYNKIKRARKRDTVLNIGISKEKGELDFYIFDLSYLSTFDKDEADKYIGQGYTLKKVVKVAVTNLNDIFDSYVKGKQIDFMSIDTEGYDQVVLDSNDWSKNRPGFVILETLEHNTKGIPEKMNKVYDPFFAKINYSKIADTNLNTIYICNDYAKKNGFII